MQIRIYIIVILILTSTAGFSQTAKFSNEFLSIGVGAKSLALSNSIVASTNDVTAGYWNPAALVNMPYEFDLGLMHAEYFAGIAKYDYLAGAMKLDSTSALGISIIRFGVDDIPNTTELIDNDGNLDYDRISYFSAADYAFLLTYSKKNIWAGLNIGANVKIIYRNIGKFANAWGFGLDAALHYRLNKWQFGLMARDITSTFNAWSFNEDELLVEVSDSIFNFAPDNSLELTLPRVVLAAAREFTIYNKFSALAEIDACFTFDGQRHVLVEGDPVSIDPGVGIEIDYDKLIFIRFGFGNFQRERNVVNENEMTFQPNFGIGISFKGFTLDYALTDIGDQSVAVYSNVFSLRYSFDKKR